MSPPDSEAYPASRSLSHLLYSNQAPSSLELASIQEGIANITATMSELRSQLKGLEDQLFRHRAALAPIRRLPAEVLNEIFNFALPAERTLSDEGNLTNLQLVCRAWEAASYLQWARLQVYLSHRRPLPCSRIGSWFDRARKCGKTLDLCIALRHVWGSCYCSSFNPRCYWANADLQSVLHDTKSLASLGMEFTFPRCFHNFLAALALSLPPARKTWGSLTSLKLTFRHAGYTSQFNLYQTLLSNLPTTLKTLHLSLGSLTLDRSPPSHTDIDIPQTPFQHLTIISLSCCWNSPIILSVLRHCPVVEVLHLDFEQGTHNWTENVAEVHLTRVHTLSLYLATPSVASNILSRLHFLSLQSLRVSDVREGGRMLWDILDSLQVMSSSKPSTMRFLKVTEIGVDPGALADALWRLPTLEHLALSHVEFDVEVFLESCGNPIRPKVNPPEHDSDYVPAKLLPSLKLLEVHDIPKNFDVERLLQFFKARKQTAKELGSHDTLRRIVVSPRSVSCEEWKRQWEKCYLVIQELQRNHAVVVDRLAVLQTN